MIEIFTLISQYYVFDFMCGWYNIKIFVENSALFYYENSAEKSVLWLFRSDWNRLNPEGIFPRSMIKNRIVVREKSTNKNRTFVLFSYLHLYTFKKMSDIIGTVTRTNSKNMTEPEPGIIRYFRVLFYPQKSVLWLLFVTRWKRHLFTIKMSFSLRIWIRIFGWYWS